MKSIKILKMEHQNILRMLTVAKKIAQTYIDGRDFDPDELLGVSAFISEYADSHHHGKEEAILFKYMKDKLGGAATKLIDNGMMVEHDLGRYYNMSLKEASLEYKENKSKELGLSILTYLLAYVDLLSRHIEKEDSVVYTFAQKSLGEADKKEIETKSQEFENENGKNIQVHLDFLQNLEKKYL